jgi:hypothetical protein
MSGAVQYMLKHEPHRDVLLANLILLKYIVCILELGVICIIYSL